VDTLHWNLKHADENWDKTESLNLLLSWWVESIAISRRSWLECQCTDGHLRRVNCRRCCCWHNVYRQFVPTWSIVRYQLLQPTHTHTTHSLCTILYSQSTLCTHAHRICKLFITSFRLSASPIFRLSASPMSHQMTRWRIQSATTTRNCLALPYHYGFVNMQRCICNRS